MLMYVVGTMQFVKKQITCKEKKGGIKFGKFTKTDKK
jgi:hypothetical protein